MFPGETAHPKSRSFRMWNRFVEIATFRTCKLLARLFPPQPKSLPRQARLILVFSTTGLGDGLFDSAAIRNLKLGHPAAKLIVCAHRTRSLCITGAWTRSCYSENPPFANLDCSGASDVTVRTSS